MDINSNFLGTTIEGGKLSFDARLPQLASVDNDALKVYNAMFPGQDKTPTQQAVDANYYAAKVVGAVSSFEDLFKSDDAISVGVGNLSQGQPSSSEFLLCTHIQLQYALLTAATTAALQAGSWNLIIDAMRNGTIKILQQNREILPEQSMEKFFWAQNYQVSGDTNAAAGTPVTNTLVGMGNVGLVRLENPKWIYPDRRIEVFLKFASAMPSANSAVRIILHGVKNSKL